MDKIYIVMDGCIGDEGIADIFTTNEKAEKFIQKEINKAYKPWIEEWDVK